MLTLQDAKTMLFIDNTETETGKSSVVSEDGVSADYQVNLTRSNRSFDISLIFGGAN